MKNEKNNSDRQPVTREEARMMQSKKKRTVLVVAIIVIIILLGGCFLISRAQTNHSNQTNSNRQTKVTKSKRSRVKGNGAPNEKSHPYLTSSSSEMLDDSSENSSFSYDSSSKTSQFQSSMTTVISTSAVDQKNLTTNQVNTWIYSTIMEQWNNEGNQEPLTANDENAFTFSQSFDDQNCVVVQVRENHQSAYMKKNGNDSATDPTIGWYRVDQNGNLQMRDQVTNQWETISKTYQEPTD